MRRAGCLCDLLLSEAELESPLPQMRGDRADLTKGANTLVFRARGTVRLAATRATTRRLCGGATNRILGSESHKSDLITDGKSR